MTHHTITRTLAILTATLLLAACDKQPEPPHTPPTDNQHAEQHTENHDDHAHDQPASNDAPVTLDNLPEGVNNIVQYEMQILTTAMQDILSHIANGELAKIPVEIGKVHPIYELTHSALEQGLYNPPANSDNVAGFVARDEAFHEDLVVMVRAARANDLQATTTAYSKLVEGCTSCHTEFRFAQP